MTTLTRSRGRAARLAFVPLLAIAAATAIVPAASAQAPNAKALAEARTRYEKGKQLYKEGAFDAALAELQRSYELAPSYKILYNIALVQRARNDFAGTLNAYEKYLADGGKELSAARKQEVQKELENLRTLVVRVEIKTNVPDADVSVDDVPAGKSPLAGLVLNPGSHRISASKEGRRSAVKVIKVAGGDAVTVELELAEASPSQSGGGGTSPTAEPTGDPDAAPPPSDSASSSTPPPPLPGRGPVWIGWAVTGALAVGAGVTGGLAMGQAASHAELRKQPGVTQDQLDASRSDAKTLAIVTDVLVPCAIVAGALSLYFSVRSVEPDRAGLAGLRIVAAPAVGPSGVSGATGAISGSF